MKQMKRWIFWVQQQLGRRGASLLFFAFLDFVFALLLWRDSDDVLAPRHAILLRVMPPMGWALAWMFEGIVCLVFAWRKQDNAAFGLAMAFKVLWGTGVGVTIFLHPAPPFAWVFASLWFALCALIGIIAGWPEFPHKRRS